MIARICAIIGALALAASVVFLGWRSNFDSAYVWWFGLASAFAAPIALSFISYAFNSSDRDLIKKLSKVPSIEELVRAAETQQAKIELLEKEKNKLTEIIRLESKRIYIRNRIESLDQDAVRIISEYSSLEKELKEITTESESFHSVDEIEKLRARMRARDDGDFVLSFRGDSYILKRSFFEILPFGLGKFTWVYFNAVNDLVTFLEKLTKKNGKNKL